MRRPIAGRIAMPNIARSTLQSSSPDRMLSVRRSTPPSLFCEPQRGLAPTSSAVFAVGVEGRGLPEGRANQGPSSVFHVWGTAPSIAAQTTARQPASQPGPLDWVRTDGRVIPAERLALRSACLWIIRDIAGCTSALGTASFYPSLLRSQSFQDTRDRKKWTGQKLGTRLASPAARDAMACRACVQRPGSGAAEWWSAGG